MKKINHNGKFFNIRMNDLPFISYIYLNKPHIGIEWGEGFVLRIIRFYLKFKIKWFKQ